LETWTVPREFTSLSAAEERDALTTQEVAPVPRPAAARRALRWWLPAAVVALLALGSLFRGSGNSPDTAAMTGSALPASHEIATARPAVGPAAAADAATPLAEVLTRLVEEWAAAWSSQDADRYLAFYSPDFVPESGGSHSSWAAQRRESLTRPAFVKVTLDGLQIADEDSHKPRTVFTQRYESNTFTDEVAKSLTWIRSQGSWRISREGAAPRGDEPAGETRVSESRDRAGESSPRRLPALPPHSTT